MAGRTPGLTALLITVLLALAATGCGRSGPTSSPARGGRLLVVVAENTWGSIARQLAGDRASVRSIIENPAADPHTYAPSAADARALAGANLVVVNGLAYDNWATQLLAATADRGRVVLDVGRLLGLPRGANPHRWYYPADVRAVIEQIGRDYAGLDPAHASFYRSRRAAFESRGLARYDELRRQIRHAYAGVPVGYSESIFQGLGEDLGLRLMTPYSFTKAIAEGGEVNAGDKQTVDAQAREREIAVWVRNAQNVTPDVERVDQLARAARIPIATVTETLSPASSSFEQWQVSELEGLRDALHRATGR